MRNLSVKTILLSLFSMNLSGNLIFAQGALPEAQGQADPGVVSTIVSDSKQAKHDNNDQEQETLSVMATCHKVRTNGHLIDVKPDQLLQFIRHDLRTPGARITARFYTPEPLSVLGDEDEITKVADFFIMQIPTQEIENFLVSEYKGYMEYKTTGRNADRYQLAPPSANVQEYFESIQMSVPGCEVLAPTRFEVLAPNKSYYRRDEVK